MEDVEGIWGTFLAKSFLLSSFPTAKGAKVMEDKTFDMAQAIQQYNQTYTSAVPMNVSSNLTGYSGDAIWYYPYNACYPTYNRTEKAFQVVQALLAKKYIKLSSVAEFINLVNELVKVL